MNRRHVVLVTYGEPPTPAFAAQLRYSWRILLGLTRTVAPIPAWVLPMIAVSRGRSRRALWTAERYGSPLEPCTQAQARALAPALAAAAPGVDWQVHVAYEFRDPPLPETLDRLPAGEAVDVIPMYAADSAFTHALTRQTAAHWLARTGRGPVRVLPAADPERLADVSARHLLAAAGDATGPDWALVLAAHGTLLEPPRPMDTGREATEDLRRRIEARIAGRFGLVAHGWLNHTMGGRWTEPPMEEALQAVAAAGFRKVVYYPFGFLADNAETQLEGRLALRPHAFAEARQLPCLNDAPALAALLAAMVAGAPGAVAAPAVEAEPVATR